MLTPSVSTLADYNSAILSGKPPHVQMVFPVHGVTLTDDDVSASGGIVLTQMLNPDTDLAIGRAVCCEVVINLLNKGQFASFDWSEEFRLDFGVEIGGSTEWVTVGYFTGSKPNRVTRAEIITFTAYDRMKLAEVPADDFLGTVTFPITIANFYYGLCTYLGLSYVTGDNVSTVSNYNISSNVFTAGLTCRDLFAYIAESLGCNIKITSTGAVKLVWYTDQTSVYTLTGDQYFDIDIDEANVPAIDSVRLSSTDDATQSFIYPVGSNNVIYQIVDNPIMLQLSSSRITTNLTRLTTRFSGFGTYTPINVNAIGNWMVEVGDIITVQYDGNQTVSLPIFNRSLQWNGGCFDVYECTGKAERTGYSESVKDKYDLGSKVSTKYTIKSGVDITDQGVTISGGKFLKLISGGVLDVQATNFIIDSTNKIVQSGDWIFFDNGLKIRKIDHSLTFDMGIGSNVTEADASYGVYIMPRVAPFAGSQYLPSIAFGSIDQVNANKRREWQLGIAYGDALNETVSDGLNHAALAPLQSQKDMMIGTDILPFLCGWFKQLSGDAVQDNLTTTQAGYVLDARQGKALMQYIKLVTAGYAVVVTGNTSLRTIHNGDYVFVFDSTIYNTPDGLYTANADISAGTAVVSSNLTSAAGGGLNDLADTVASLTTTVNNKADTSDVNTTKTVSSPVTWGSSYAAGDAANRGVAMRSCGKTRNLYIYFKPNSASSGWTTIATIASGHRPAISNITCIATSSASTPVVKQCRINSSGELQMLSRTTDSFELSITYLVA